jgi:hypothetical protein
MKIKWIREDQSSPDFGALNQGETIDCEALKIPDDVVRSWIADGWAEEIKAKPVKDKTGG